jgi:3-deoxy-D-manno-octulosonic-acid transferase
MRLIYNSLLIPIRLTLELWAACLGSGSPSRERWSQRLGRGYPRLPTGGVWLHGASVGEVRILRLLCEAIRPTAPGLPLATSARTATGRELLPDPSPSTASFYAPLDFPAGTRRLLDTLRPSLVILVETEIWPNMLHEIHLRGIPVVVLNARLSQKRMSTYVNLSAIYRPLLERLSLVAAQSDEDAARYRQLGVPGDVISVTGNIKYDLPVPSGDARTLRQRFGLAETRPVIVAGSTGPGEEALVIQAFQGVLEALPDSLLILAPRHLERMDEVERLVRATPLVSTRLSDSDSESLNKAAVWLVDSMGELSELYRLAWVAFVGGSLVPVGGHNLLEPAALSVPVLFGPHIDSVMEPATALIRSGGGRCVHDVNELSAALVQLVEDTGLREETGLKARQVLEQNRGALQKSLTLLRPFLEAPR